MELRKKFGLLALIYVLSLSANLALSAYCILVYFRSAFIESEATFALQQRLDRLRTQVGQQAAMRAAASAPADDAEDWRMLVDEIESMTLQTADGPLAELWPDVASIARRADDDPEALAQLEQRLTRAGLILSQQWQRTVERADETQQTVRRILIANTLSGVVLCVVGLIFVRRWVIRPVADLREATKQIAGGNFAHRVQPRSRDELGQLAREVNEMAGTIVSMQTRLIVQERLAAAGEMVTRVAHNIRNPLAGIRGLAESVIESNPRDPDTVQCQRRIIDTIDRFEKWLRDLQQSVSPLELNLQRVRIDELVGNVVTVLRPMLVRKQVHVDVRIDPAMTDVTVDNLHFEQALVALVTNAVQASQAGQTIRVRAEPSIRNPQSAIRNAAGLWCLTVEDEGPGIPPDLREKIFLPYFTTKPDGNGIGLAMASKVLKTHGGSLTVESEPGRGSRFAAVLPGMVLEA